MADPKAKKLIIIKVTNAGANDYIKIHNRTQSWTARVKSNAQSEVIYNPATDNYTAADGDSIVIYATGRLKGGTTGTITGGALDTSFTATIDTNLQMVNL